MSKTQPIPPDTIVCRSSKMIWESSATVSPSMDADDPLEINLAIRHFTERFEEGLHIRLCPEDANRIADQLKEAARQALEYQKQLDDHKQG